MHKMILLQVDTPLQRLFVLFVIILYSFTIVVTEFNALVTSIDLRYKGRTYRNYFVLTYMVIETRSPHNTPYALVGNST